LRFNQFLKIIVKAPYFFVFNCYDALIFCYLHFQRFILIRKLRVLSLQCAGGEKVLQPIEHMEPNVGIDRRAPAVCRAAQASPHAFRRTAGACPCRMMGWTPPFVCATLALWSSLAWGSGLHPNERSPT
jgi:hypothetical protein